MKEDYETMDYNYEVLDEVAIYVRTRHQNSLRELVDKVPITPDLNSDLEELREAEARIAEERE